MHYALFYNYAPDYLARRDQFRSAHLQMAWDSHARGEFLLGGVLAEPIDSALLVFRADSPQVVEDFVAADPYVRNGLVTSWTIRPWMTVAGEGACNPVRP
ncbi:MAG: YciI-like protein [Telluria sp.]